MTESLVTQNKDNQNKFITWLYKSDTHKNSYIGNTMSNTTHKLLSFNSLLLDKQDSLGHCTCICLSHVLCFVEFYCKRE